MDDAEVANASLLKVVGVTWNKFIWQNYGRGVTFKRFISKAFRSRFRLNLKDILGNNGSSPVLFFYSMNRALR